MTSGEPVGSQRCAGQRSVRARAKPGPDDSGAENRGAGDNVAPETRHYNEHTGCEPVAVPPSCWGIPSLPSGLSLDLSLDLSLLSWRRSWS